MNNQLMSNGLTFGALINEAFIKPIRSVTVIDDEYPTISGLLNKNKYTKINEERLKEVISFCQDPARNWLVDIDDGQSFPEPFDGDIGSYTNSDLLILDYHLEKGSDGDRSLKALNVIKSLAKKTHFNLTVIHTSGYHGDGNDVEKIIIDVIAYLQKPANITLNKGAEKVVLQFLDDATLEDDDIERKLINSITDLEFLSVLNEFNGNLSACFESKKFDEFIRLCEESNVKYSKKPMIQWLCNKKNISLEALYGNEDINGLSWKVENGVNWIKTDNLFVTIIGKSVRPSEIPSKLCDALFDWCPHPHQLLLAKLRHEIDENGFMIANQIVNKRYLQSYWLKEILDADDEYALESKIWNVLSKHWEEIAVSTKDAMIDFSSRISQYIKSLPEGNLSEFMSKWTVSDMKEVLQHVNKFNCSIPIAGYHLNTGHVLQLDDNSYWVCMTPACDLEPGQKRSKTGKNMPVTLVRLFTLSEAAKKDDKEPALLGEEQIVRALSMATRNDLIFISLMDSEKINIFSSVPRIYSSANPVSDNFLVGNQGRFTNGDRTLVFFKPTAEEEQAPTFKEIKGKVVAQLRYEYALHLLQVTGRTKSRIGLDFVSLNDTFTQ
ncbi:response regulator receiver domain [Serratia fonticola]|uniref:response regulator receiver domain n=1 Tax=Serratia fonticola TaxID=47917 RepID=UPI0024DE2F82|nr:response regulator receiver domain [Serratia fonticola]MDK2376717.1 response regulator receiver domain [Serratia fonticola]